jgi:hypothetical protein
VIEKFPGRLARRQVYLGYFNIPLNDGQEIIKVMRNASGEHS